MTEPAAARANLLLFAVTAAMLLLIGGLTWDRFNAARTARLSTERSFQVIGRIKDLGIGARDAETGQRGFLLTGDEDYLIPYRSALDRVSYLQGELQRLTADDPVEQDRLRTLSPILQRKLEELAQTVELRQTAGLDPALRVVRTNVGRNLTKAMETILAAMTADEGRLLDEREAATDRRGAAVRLLVVLGSAVAALALLWAARMLNGALSASGRVASEQRVLSLQLKASLDSLSQGVGVFDAEHRLGQWNECFQVLLSLPRAMVRTGAPYAAFCEHAGGEGLALESEEQVRAGRVAAGGAVTYGRSRPGGHEIELRRTSMPDGGFVLTVTDMTKRAQAEGILRESQKMQAMGQLTGGIAHDFNNLLTVILGNLEFLQSRADCDGPTKARLERASWAARRGATLTAQLLAFARKTPLAPSPIDLSATMPDLVPLLRRTLGEHIEIRYVDSAGLWPALADPAQLESAVLNLALNARDAMPGGGRLTIELANKVLDDGYAAAHADVAAGDYAMLAVSDTGHGMVPEVVARVFEPFFTTKPDGKGTGLGLAMVFGFVKQTGGHIKIYSEPGQGTTVRLYLPRAAAAPAQPRTVAPVELPRGTATVLVVEDDAAVREIAVTMLADLGYRVLEAADGDQALQVFGVHAAGIDLLLTDVVLPGSLRGRELAERIQAVRPGVKVLFMSGYTENSIVHHGRLDDGVQLISKPFRRDQLARKLQETLGNAPAAAARRLGGGAEVVDLNSRRP